METTERVLLHINLDVNQLKKSAADAVESIAKLKQKQEELEKSTGKNTVEYKTLSQQISVYTKQLTDATKALAINENLSKDNTNSLADLRLQLTAATLQYKTYSSEQAENSEQAIELAAHIKALSDEIKAQELSLGNAARNVGNYSEALQPLNEEIKGLRKSQEAWQRTMSGLHALQSTSSTLLGENSEASNALKSAVNGLGLMQDFYSIKLGISSSLQLANTLQLKTAKTATTAQTTATGLLASIQTFLQVQFGASAVAARVLSIALLAIPLVAVVAGITLAVSALTEFISKQREASDAVTDLNKKLAQQFAVSDAIRDNFLGAGSAFDQLNQKSERAIELATAKGASDKLIHDLKVEQINQELQALQQVEDAGVILSAKEHTRREDLINKLKVLDAEYYNSLKEKREQSEKDYGDFLSREFDMFNEQQKLIDDAIAFVSGESMEQMVDRLVQEQAINDKMQTDITAFNKKELDKRITDQREYSSAMNDVDSARAEFVGALSSSLLHSFKESSLAYKLLFSFEKGAAIANVIIKLQEQLAAISATAALTAGPAAPVIAAAQSSAAKIRAATSIGVIIAQTLPAFAGGGGVSGKRIMPGDGRPIYRSNGDNLLATIRTNEVILNERQQAALGGPGTFRAIGVPGFADGGYAGRFATANAGGIMDKETLIDAIKSVVIVTRISDINEVNGKINRVTELETI